MDEDAGPPPCCRWCSTGSVGRFSAWFVERAWRRGLPAVVAPRVRVVLWRRPTSRPALGLAVLVAKSLAGSSPLLPLALPTSIELSSQTTPIQPCTLRFPSGGPPFRPSIYDWEVRSPFTLLALACLPACLLPCYRPLKFIALGHDLFFSTDRACLRSFGPQGPPSLKESPPPTSSAQPVRCLCAARTCPLLLPGIVGVKLSRWQLSTEDHVKRVDGCSPPVKRDSQET